MVLIMIDGTLETIIASVFERLRPRSSRRLYLPPITVVSDAENRGGLTSDRIDRFATFNADKKSVDEGCAICIDGVEMNKLMVKLNCGHFYCSECIRKWFEDKVSCPLCRKVYHN